MFTLHIEHSTPDYDRWKATFDSDPADRKGSGVKAYRINRRVADPLHVIVDLDFDDVASAEALLAQLKQMWKGPGVGLIVGPSGTIMEQVESAEL